MCSWVVSVLRPTERVVRPSTSISFLRRRRRTQTSVCPWKGTARYLDLVVDGQVIPGAAWYYPEPTRAAAEIKGRVAFWRGVQVAA